MSMATLNEQIATDCIYTLKRKQKKGGVKIIKGGSIRLAEIIVNGWGNMRAGARIVGRDDKFVTVQGICMDLENNTAISTEIERRHYGGDDSISLAANAGASIALRNAVFKCIPQALWDEVYEAARKTALGDESTLVERRQKCMAFYKSLGVDEKRVFDAVEAKSIEDIGLEQLETLKGLGTAIRTGEYTVDEAFPIETEAKSGSEGLKETLKRARSKKQTETEVTCGECGKIGPPEGFSKADDDDIVLCHACQEHAQDAVESLERELEEPPKRRADLIAEIQTFKVGLPPPAFKRLTKSYELASWTTEELAALTDEQLAELHKSTVAAKMK